MMATNQTTTGVDVTYGADSRTREELRWYKELQGVPLDRNDVNGSQSRRDIPSHYHHVTP